jgi:hypothetical protein
MGENPIIKGQFDGERDEERVRVFGILWICASLRRAFGELEAFHGNEEILEHR